MSEQKISASEQKKEDWMNAKWRPLMGYVYMIVCMCDFVIFPVLWSLIQALHGGRVETQWSPITLNGAGLFHMAMGAIIGVAAFGRTQEKIAGASTASTTVNLPMPAFSNAPGTPAPTSAPAFTPAPPPAFGAKPLGPGRVDHPEL